MVLHKTFRRKLGILTALLRAIIDILCIYSANLHPNGDDVGFVSVHLGNVYKNQLRKTLPAAAGRDNLAPLRLYLCGKLWAIAPFPSNVQFRSQNQ